MNSLHPKHLPAPTPLFISLIILICSLLSLPAIAQDTVTEQDSSAVDTLVVAEESATEPLPATNVAVVDRPNDGGGALNVTWDTSPDDHEAGDVAGYLIFRSTSQEGPFAEIGVSTEGQSVFNDGRTDDDSTYYYRVDAYTMILNEAGEATRLSVPSIVAGPVGSSAQWFNSNRSWALLWVIIVGGSIIFFINRAKSGQKIYVRKIAGIDAVDEALGRATEMGRKVFYVPGIQDMNDVQTIAGIAILGRVAQYAAEYDTYLEVPVCKSLVMVTARETMKEAYSKAGRPDSYSDDQVHYLTDDQFGYAAAIDGMVVREKPATIFYMGAFFAESLILAETGNAAGAIQIAGTAMPSQLPFFVAACDYTLIGEELFAASAYLSKEPRQLGSLKGQDVGKAIFLAAIIIGALSATFGLWDLSPAFLVN